MPDTADLRLSSVYTGCSNGSTDCPNWGNNRTTFGLSFTDPIAPSKKSPAPDSPASTGPEGGALVLFRMSEESVTQSLPLDLKIPAPAGKESNIRLDL